MSSPSDTALLRQKQKRKTQSRKNKDEIGFGTTVEMCEEGLSPKLTFERNLIR